MLEMKVMPEQWRAASRDDREYLLAISRNMRREKNIESRGKDDPPLIGIEGAGAA